MVVKRLNGRSESALAFFRRNCLKILASPRFITSFGGFTSFSHLSRASGKALAQNDKGRLTGLSKHDYCGRFFRNV